MVSRGHRAKPKTAKYAKQRKYRKRMRRAKARKAKITKESRQIKKNTEVSQKTNIQQTSCTSANNVDDAKTHTSPNKSTSYTPQFMKIDSPNSYFSVYPPRFISEKVGCRESPPYQPYSLWQTPIFFKSQ